MEELSAWQASAWQAISASGCYMGVVCREDGYNWWVTDNGGKSGVMVLAGGLEPTLDKAKASAEAAAAKHTGKMPRPAKRQASKI